MAITDYMALNGAEAISSFIDANVTLFFVILIVIAVLKGVALWKSARRKETAWFISIFIFNTLGILPAIYLILKRKK